MLESNIYDKLLKNITKNIASSYIHPSYALEKELLMYIKLMDEEKSFQVLKQINSLERASLSEIPLNSMKNSLICSCTLFTRAVIEAGVDSETAFMASDLYINKVDKGRTMEYIQSLEYDMVKDFINLIRMKKDLSYNPLVRKIMFYIKQNIQHKITLEDIAKYTGFHRNYLSGVFKSEVGVAIGEYISKTKLELIKVFLVESSLTLSEIAFNFDFSSQAHFSRYFKEHCGTSPLRYRNLYSKKL